MSGEHDAVASGEINRPISPAASDVCDALRTPSAERLSALDWVDACLLRIGERVDAGSVHGHTQIATAHVPPRAGSARPLARWRRSPVCRWV